MHTQPTFKKHIHKMVTLVAFGLFALAAHPVYAADYTFSDFGIINGPYAHAGAYAINNLGQVAGTRQDASGLDVYYPIRWDGEVATQLDYLGVDPPYTFANAINNNGQIAGQNWMSTGNFTAVRWDGNAITDLGGLGGTHSFGWGINDAGLVVGMSDTTGDDSRHATLWTGNAITDLGTLGGNNSEAWGINGTGQVVGNSLLADEATTHAALWNGSGAAPVDLGSLGGDSYAYSINDAEQIVGNSILADGTTTHAALWNSSIAAPVDLGSLGSDSFTHAINNAGQIVGESIMADGSMHATLWEHGIFIDLNNYLGSDLKAAGWYLFQGSDINDKGVIVGFAANGPDLSTALFAPFMLTPTPVPVPAAVWLFGSGLAGLVGVLKRRQARAA
jgi:probable HAF family extracellular repeat protein